MTNRRLTLIALPMTIAALAARGCGSSGSSSPTTDQASSAEAKSAATGDIPDNQVFLTFRNRRRGTRSLPGGLDAEGIGRRRHLQDKDNSVHVAVASGPPATVASVRAALAKQKASEPTLTAQPPTTVSLKHEPRSRSPTRSRAPRPGDRQAALLVVDRYVYSRGGKVATVTSEPKGVDNVDAYRLISNSFRGG